ncbi:MAG: hypothetical protein MJ213_05505, partial [Bacilli bacterium]|nr:hypothetical protein [Bacilli bacterium]
NITVKLPLLQHDRSKDAVEFKYNEDVAEFGTNSSLLRAKVSTQNVTNNEEIDYFEVSVPNFAAYTLTSEQDGIYNYDEVKTVGGLAPTCSADGYKSCYEKGGNYYEDPTTQTPIADYEAWKTGAGKLNQLTTHDNIHFESKFDESTKEFTFDIICDDCGETIDTKTLSGTFVKDSDADCTECAKGHYVAFGKYESNLSPKTLTLVGKTEARSADEPGSEPIGHDLTHHFGIPATCTRNGIKPYWKCDDCEACFYDEGATQPVNDPEDLILPKLNHEMTYHPASEATETKSGNKEYWTCSHCNGFFLDEDGNEQTSESEILIPPTLHIYVQTAEMKEVRPTHYTSGHKAYYYCAKDNSYAIDSKGYEGIDDINIWLAPGGEGYIPKESCEFGGPVSYVISNDKCTATHACMYPGCKEVEQETVDAAFIVDTPATCTEDARGHYIAEFTNPEFGTYSTSLNSDVRVGTATGHKFTVATPTWNGNLCTVSGTCENCHKSLSLTKEGTLVIDTPATCTTNAIGHYEVEFDNLRIEKQFTDPFTINNSALGHLFDNGECTRCHAKDPSAGAMSTGGIVGLTIGCSVGSVLIYAVVQYLINTKKIGKKKKTSKR